MTMRRLSILLVCTFSALQGMSANAQEFDLQPPGDREFISDQTRLLDELSVTHIRSVCEQLLNDKATPGDEACVTIHVHDPLSGVLQEAVFVVSQLYG